MAAKPFPSDCPWNDILEHAVRAPGSSQDVRLFLEQREDVRLAWSEGKATASGTLWCGLSAERAGSARHLSDPSPDDVSRISSFSSEGPSRAGLGPTRTTAPWCIDGVDRVLLRSAVEDLARLSMRQAGVVPAIAAVAYEQRVWVADSEQGGREDRRRSLRLRVDAEARRGTRRARAVVEVTRPSAANLDEGTLERTASQLAERIEGSFDRREVPGGESVAVLAPGLGGILAHEIVGHALEGDTVHRHASWLGAIDGKVAPLDLLIVDDPRRGRGAWRIDDEGVEPRATALIDGGRVAGALHDRRSAARLGVRPTGHGRRASFRDPVLPRMGCTYIAAGRHVPAELLANVAQGIYVRRMEAASVDRRSGRAVFRVADSDLIVRGALAGPLLPYLCVVDGPRVLANLRLVADDLSFDTCIGTCHRDGQALAIGVGAPTICIGVSVVSPVGCDATAHR